jgi:hypothetical protein
MKDLVNYAMSMPSTSRSKFMLIDLYIIIVGSKAKGISVALRIINSQKYGITAVSTQVYLTKREGCGWSHFHQIFY